VVLPEKAILERAFRYSARSELESVSDTLRGDIIYGYDDEGRLLKHYEARQGHSTSHFAYDNADNLAANDDALHALPVTDNRLHHWQNLFMKYDDWGNLVSRRSGLHEQHFTYDAENRLITAKGNGPDGGFTAHYHYDALGRRTRKVVSTQHDRKEVRFLWQGYRLLQEQQENGQRQTYLYDPNEAWSPLARIDHMAAGERGDVLWFNTDLNGAPLEVTDERGDIRWSGQYGSFGEVRRQTEGFTRLAKQSALPHQPLRYAGQYADSETGLHYNLFRYYDPQVGRFTVQDPIGLEGGWNLYQYAPNPLSWVDPLGLSNCGAPNKKTSYEGISRRDAFRQAKRDAGIPMNQHPSSITRPDLLDGSGKKILDSTGQPIKTRQYEFVDKRGQSVFLQEHSLGHTKATSGHGAEPHFNLRPLDNLNTGSVPGTHGHYNFP